MRGIRNGIFDVGCPRRHGAFAVKILFPDIPPCNGPDIPPCNGISGFGGNSGFVGKKRATSIDGYDPFLSTKCVPIVSEIFGVKMDIIATISYMRTRLGVLIILHLRLAYLRTTRT